MASLISLTSTLPTHGGAGAPQVAMTTIAAADATAVTTTTEAAGAARTTTEGGGVAWTQRLGDHTPCGRLTGRLISIHRLLEVDLYVFFSHFRFSYINIFLFSPLLNSIDAHVLLVLLSLIV